MNRCACVQARKPNRVIVTCQWRRSIFRLPRLSGKCRSNSRHAGTIKASDSIGYTRFWQDPRLSKAAQHVSIQSNTYHLYFERLFRVAA